MTLSIRDCWQCDRCSKKETVKSFTAYDGESWKHVPLLPDGWHDFYVELHHRTLCRECTSKAGVALDIDEL